MSVSAYTPTGACRAGDRVESKGKGVQALEEPGHLLIVPAKDGKGAVVYRGRERGEKIEEAKWHAFCDQWRVPPERRAEVWVLERWPVEGDQIRYHGEREPTPVSRQ